VTASTDLSLLHMSRFLREAGVALVVCYSVVYFESVSPPHPVFFCFWIDSLEAASGEECGEVVDKRPLMFR